MTSYERMMTELILYAHGAIIQDIKENIAVNEQGELIREAKIIALKNVPVEEIEITVQIGDL